MKYIIGKKLGMIQLFDENGTLLPVTVVQCEPNKVIETKENRTIVVGFEKINEKKLNKPQLGYFKKHKVNPYSMVAQFSDLSSEYSVGHDIKVEEFENGQLVDVQGTTRGRGFTGAIVRWNYKVGPKSHGAGFPHRYQGSIAFGRGGSQGQRVPKGKKMAGHYGHEVVTTENLVLLQTLPKLNVLLIMGAVPGPVGSTVIVKTSVKKPNKKIEFKIITKELKEQILEANEQLEDKDLLRKQNEEAEAAEAAQIKAEEKQKEAEAAKAKAEAETIAKKSEAVQAEDAAKEEAKEKAEAEAKMQQAKAEAEAQVEEIKEESEKGE